MEVNGLPLPATLVQAVEDGQTKWMFKALVNAYGDETGYLTVDLVDFETMRGDSPDNWPSNTPTFKSDYQTRDETGWMPYIHELSRLVLFGRERDDVFFCLDYRDNLQEPGVIRWTWNNWRRVAPSFTAFMELLEPYNAEKYWQKANEIVGHHLPAAFTELSDAIRRGEAPNEWELKENVDAYGQPWEVADLRLNFTDPLSLKSNTDWISHAFLHEGRLPQFPAEGCEDEPGFIADFTGVDNFVWLGSSTAGDTYAFDFGSDPKEPSVVYWDQYWRRVAPNFESFMALFIESGYAPGWDDDGYELVPRPPRDLLEVQARWYVLASRESVRRLFEDVEDYYALCSADERRDAESEVRERLERDGTTDEQRRTLDELWVRLHAMDQGKRRAIVVNGFELPAAFVHLCEVTQRSEAPWAWVLKENVDAYGRPWEDVDLRLLTCYPKSFQSRTDGIANAFLHEGRLPQLPSFADQPGFITDFTGVANFVWLGSSTDGKTYAFDFGTDPREPSVVYWDQYWRRVAPNFAAFIALFMNEREARPPDDRHSEPISPTPRTLLAAWVPQYVVATPPEARPFEFTRLAHTYAELSPEERREVEAEVREELERHGMTDIQRRILDDVWARLDLRARLGLLYEQ